MNILILGASGLVGGNCLNLFSGNSQWKVAGTHFSFPTEQTQFFNTLRLDDPDNFDIAAFRPSIILHAGALTHVDHCEDHEEESYQKTVQSTANVALLVKQYNAKFIYISTDYVFDGTNGPYDEEAEVNPLSVYGRHKLEAENIVRATTENHLILRITNVYGDEIRNKNFISRIVEAIIEGKTLQLRLPYDQYATPANAFDIARMLYLLIGDDKKGLYHVASTDSLNRVQLAQRILKHFPVNRVEVIPATTAEIAQKAPRPLQGGLKPQKFLAEYPDFHFSNVDDFLRSKEQV
ncbi:MAG: SDR family oxidoreductase [Bacteroidia bacterium]